MRIVIAEDSVLLREGLTRLLEEAGVEVAATAGDAEAFLRAVDANSPDAVVVDVRMPPTFSDEGLRAALVVRKRWPNVGVLVLSQYVEAVSYTHLDVYKRQRPARVRRRCATPVRPIEPRPDRGQQGGEQCGCLLYTSRCV